MLTHCAIILLAGPTLLLLSWDTAIPLKIIEELAKGCDEAHGIAGRCSLATPTAAGAIVKKLLTQHLEACCQWATRDSPLTFCTTK